MKIWTPTVSLNPVFEVKNTFSSTEGNVDWEARLWYGNLVDEQAFTSLLYNNCSVLLAHGLASSREGLTVSILPSVIHQYQRLLLKVSSSDMLSFVVCHRCEPQQRFHCWLLWWDGGRSPPDSVFASGSSVQHGLPLCLQHETGESWAGGGATMLRLTSFPTSFWSIVDSWEEKKVAARLSLRNHKDLTIHFFIFSNKPVYPFIQFSNLRWKTIVLIFLFIRIFKIMFRFRIWKWREGHYSL